MKKSEMAQKFWFNRTKRQSAKAEIEKQSALNLIQKLKKIILYYFYLVLFKLALLEFYANLYVGKFFIGCFNLVNRHKIRVNALIQLRANAVGDSQK